VFIQKRLLKKLLSRVYNIYLKIKRLKMDSITPKTPAKPYKYSFKKRAIKEGKKGRRGEKIGKY
jgi:hypothetical protein